MPTATVNGIEMHYRAAGEGFPVVLIHGYTGNSRNWALTVPVLAEHFRTISVDLRGHGHSAKPERLEDYSVEQLSGDVYALIQHLGIKDCYLVGHSMGGMTAQDLILTHPEPFRALVLVDTAAESLGARAADRAKLIEIAKADGMEAVFEAQLAVQPDAAQLAANPRFVQVWREQFMLTSREAYIGCAGAMNNRRPLLNDLPNVKVPTIVICGENDAPFVVPSQHMHEKIAGSQLVMIPGCGHTPQIEKAAEFNRILLGFLSGVHEAAATRG